MAAGGDPQSNQPSVQLDEGVCTALWGGVSPEGLSCFRAASCHTFRHSLATHLPEDGYDIRTVQELLCHKDVKTTMMYTHVLNRGGKGVQSPMDRC